MRSPKSSCIGYTNKIHNISAHCYTCFKQCPSCRLLLFSKNLILFMSSHTFVHVCVYVALEKTETCLLLISTMLLKIEFDKIHIFYSVGIDDMCICACKCITVFTYFVCVWNTFLFQFFMFLLFFRFYIFSIFLGISRPAAFARFFILCISDTCKHVPLDMDFNLV